MNSRVSHALTRLALLALAAAAVAAANPSGAADPFLRRTATVKVVEEIGPAVVNIMTERVVQSRSPFRSTTGDPVFDQFFRNFFEPRTRRRTVQNLGSGVIIDVERHIITNAHVIAGASRIRISLADGREFDASLVGADPNNDLAVLQLETDKKLPSVPMGSSKNLFVGEPVIAIGNPFGLSNSVTTGVISAIDRSLHVEDRVYHGFLQTDASINPGNSGGPLLNAEGALIGINTAIYGGAQGIGFAVPIDVAQRVISELLEHGEIQPVWLGLEFQDLDPALQEVMELPKGVSGTLINGVRESSPGEQAGLQRGDVVLRVDGHVLHSAQDFYQTLGTVIDEQELTLDIWRNGEDLQFKIVAQEIPLNVIDELASRRLGMELAITQQGTLYVTGVRRGGAAARTGISVGDLLLGINGRPLRNDEDLRRALLDLRGQDRALIVVQRGGGRYHVTIRLQ